MVRTLGFHPKNRSSILLRSTIHILIMKKLTKQHVDAIASKIFSEVIAKAEVLHKKEETALKEVVIASKEVEDFRAQVKAQLPMLKVPTLSMDKSEEGWYIYEIRPYNKSILESDPHKIVELSVEKFIKRQQQMKFVPATFNNTVIRYKGLEIYRECLIDEIWLWELKGAVDKDSVDLFILQTAQRLLDKI